MIKYIIYTDLVLFKNLMLYIYAFETFLLYIVLCQGEYKHLAILDIGDQNITCVFASKGTHAT